MGEPALPPTACCLGCGYALAGVAGSVCPECGRGFDAGDPRTFDVRPGLRRRQRWARRAVLAAVLIVAFVAFGPRRLVSFTLVCPNPGGASVQSATRWELRSAEWLGSRRYAWWTTPVRTDAAPAGPIVFAEKHAWRLAWTGVVGDGGWSMSFNLRSGRDFVGGINGRAVTAERFDEAFDFLLLTDQRTPILVHPMQRGLADSPRFAQPPEPSAAK